jgi:lysophospholipase L1-like esterase
MTRKNIILIGDSIRLAYQPTVQQALTGIADVWGPAENGRTSQNVLENLEAWVLTRHPNIVHINCGTHDLRKERGSPQPRTSLEQYRANVENILRQIQTRTRAQIIWATTTPVNEKWHFENRDTDRFQADVDAYNTAANEICHRLNIPINDLFGLIMQTGRDKYILKDGLHFTPEGYALMGQAVAEAIRKYV